MSNVRGFIVHSVWNKPGITMSLFHGLVLNIFSYPHIVRFFTNYPQPIHSLYSQFVRFFTSGAPYFSTFSTLLTTTSTNLNKLINNFRKVS